MLESWSPAEIILLVVVFASFVGPIIYAWADLWLDRTWAIKTEISQQRPWSKDSNDTK